LAHARYWTVGILLSLVSVPVAKVAKSIVFSVDGDRTVNRHGESEGEELHHRGHSCKIHLGGGQFLQLHKTQTPAAT
jgi:hypothetical protein